MKNRAILSLMEQTVMILVFALAAALCLRGFVLADTQSRDYADRDRALLHLQNAADTLKACGGDYTAAAALCGGSWDGTVWVIGYDEAWAECEDSPVFRLEVRPAGQETELLGGAALQVKGRDGVLLTQLEVRWQEVGSHE